MQLGRNLHSEDFERYLNAIKGEELAQDPKCIAQFHEALDTALLSAAAEDHHQGAFSNRAAKRPHYRHSNTGNLGGL